MAVVSTHVRHAVSNFTVSAVAPFMRGNML